MSPKLLNTPMSPVSAGGFFSTGSPGNPKVSVI